MKPFTTTAVIVFMLVAVLHLLRIVMGWEVLIQGTVSPMWAKLSRVGHRQLSGSYAVA